MTYTFVCPVCSKDYDIEIPMSEYNEKKNTQICVNCNTILNRKIEWNGTATGSGLGWFGKSNGDKTI